MKKAMHSEDSDDCNDCKYFESLTPPFHLPLIKEVVLSIIPILYNLF